MGRQCGLLRSWSVAFGVLSPAHWGRWLQPDFREISAMTSNASHVMELVSFPAAAPTSVAAALLSRGLGPLWLQSFLVVAIAYATAFAALMLTTRGQFDSGLSAEPVSSPGSSGSSTAAPLPIRPRRRGRRALTGDCYRRSAGGLQLRRL